MSGPAGGAHGSRARLRLASNKGTRNAAPGSDGDRSFFRGAWQRESRTVPLSHNTPTPLQRVPQLASDVESDVLARFEGRRETEARVHGGQAREDARARGRARAKGIEPDRLGVSE